MWRKFLVFFIGATLLAGCATYREDVAKERDLKKLSKRVDVLETKVSDQGQGRSVTGVVEERIEVTTYEAPKKATAPAPRFTKKELQTALRNAGYYDGPIDGKIGSKTQKGIRDFQRDHGLKVDGIVGTQTWSKLRDYLEIK